MNKNILIGGVVVVLALGTYFLIQSNSNDTVAMEKKAREEKTTMEKKAMEEKIQMEQDAIKKDEASMTTEGATMKKDDAMMQTDEVINKDSAMMKTDKDAMAKPALAATMQKGSYELYDASKLALADTGDVVLFFKASWCPSCKAVDADIKANRASIKDGLTILEVDYDNSQALKTKYGVTYQHTFVQVDSNGNQIAKWSGSATLASLTSNVK